MANYSNIIDADHSESQSFTLATLGQRLTNLLLDFLFLRVLFIPLDFYDYSTINTSDVALISFIALYIVVSILYYAVPEYLWGRTFAKFITKTKVIKASGERPNFINCVGRTICRVAPYRPFKLFGKKPISWHDNLSKTLVVKG